MFPKQFYILIFLCRRPGGDKIYNVFDDQLPAALKRLQFDRQLSMENVKKLITEADGYQPHLIAPEQGYRRLIESTLVTIRGPAEACVDAVCTKQLGITLVYMKFVLVKYWCMRGGGGEHLLYRVSLMRYNIFVSVFSHYRIRDHCHYLRIYWMLIILHKYIFFSNFRFMPY